MTGRQENGNKLFGIMIKIKYINASKLVSCDEVLSDLFSKCQKYQVISSLIFLKGEKN